MTDIDLKTSHRCKLCSRVIAGQNSLVCKLSTGRIALSGEPDLLLIVTWDGTHIDHCHLKLSMMT